MAQAANAEAKVKMTPEQKRAFIPVMIGLGIFCLTCGANTSISSAFVLFANKFSIPITKVVIGNSFLTAFAFIMMQFSGKFMVKCGVKASMLIGYLGIAVGFLISSFAPNVYWVWIGFGVMGTTQAFGQANAIAGLIRGWVSPKVQGSYMGLMLGFFAAGGAIWPVLGGFLFTKLGLSVAFRVLIPCFMVPGIIALLLVKNSAADAGVKPIGWTESDAAVPAAGAKSAAADKTFNVFKTPAFWVCGIAMILVVFMTAQLTLFATSLQMAGMTATMATALSSLAALVALPANYFTGWLRDKFGLRSFVVFAFGMAIVSSLFLYLFLAFGNKAAMWVFVATNALSRPYMNFYPYACSYIYKDKATLVQPRMQSVSTLAGIFVTPLVSSIAEAWGGYTNVTWVWMICGLLAIIVWIAALKVGDRMNGKKPA